MKIIVAGLLFLFVPHGVAAESKDQTEQIEFITNYYKGIFGIERAKFEAGNPVFSRSLLELKDKNAKICKIKSRGDDICGFGADGDIFLNTQETGPELTFKSSDFKAEMVGLNLLEVSFTVWPKDHDYYQRKIQFKLIKEKSNWRVDNIIYLDIPKQGATSPGGGNNNSKSSMRDQIEAENSNYEKEAQSLNDTYSWVSIYLSNRDMLERVAKLIYFPIEVCNFKGKCKSIKAGSKELTQAFIRLNDFYGNNSQPIAKPKHAWPKIETSGQAEIQSPMPGRKVGLGPLTFTFKDEAWWLTKIELVKLGK